MKSPSSTSSSDLRRGRWPVAGLLALLLVLAIDGLVFRVSSPWPWLSERVDRWSHQNAISDRRTIERLEQRRDGKRYAVLMGTSRMQRAWKPNLLEPTKPDSLAVGSLAHPRIFPPEIRAAAKEMRDHPPDVVVLGVSEVDTHVPLMLDRRTSFSGAFLFIEAARHLGPAWLFEERVDFYRSALAGLFASYRYRSLLGEAGLDRLRRFRSNPKPKKKRVIDPLAAEILAEFGESSDQEPLNETELLMTNKTISHLKSVTAGPHVDAQMGFLRRAVETFRFAGSDVVILELPVHPSAKRFYDSELRADFLALAAECERDLGAHVIRLEDQPGFERSDFADLTHVGLPGAKKVSQTILTAVLESRR